MMKARIKNCAEVLNRIAREEDPITKSTEHGLHSPSSSLRSKVKHDRRDDASAECHGHGYLGVQGHRREGA